MFTRMVKAKESVMVPCCYQGNPLGGAMGDEKVDDEDDGLVIVSH